VADCDACDGFRLCAPQNRATSAGEFRIPSQRRCRLRPPDSYHIRTEAVAALAHLPGPEDAAGFDTSITLKPNEPVT